MSDPASSCKGAAGGGRHDETERSREEGHETAQESLRHHLSFV